MVSRYQPNKYLLLVYLQAVLNNATVETDNPDLRDRAYIYWRLLSTDPEVCIMPIISFQLHSHYNIQSMPLFDNKLAFGLEPWV